MEHTNKFNYSIIIPHKNAPEFLQICLDSIPRRDDIQIIVVDDNSDPTKVNFEQFPCLNDPFVEVVFTKEGKGAGYARNIGLSKAVGKWFLFADADDYFSENFITYTDKYIDSGYDLIFWGVNRISKKNPPKSNFDIFYEKITKKEITNINYDDYIYKSYVIWGKLIRSSLIQEFDIFFDETKAANDRMFSLKLAYHSKNIHFDNKKIYNYITGQSVITKNKSIEINYDRFCVYVRVNRFLENISQKKHRINLVIPLLKILKRNNMTYFFNGLKVIKENNICIFYDFFSFFSPRNIKTRLYNYIYRVK